MDRVGFLFDDICRQIQDVRRVGRPDVWFFAALTKIAYEWTSTNERNVLVLSEFAKAVSRRAVINTLREHAAMITPEVPIVSLYDVTPGVPAFKALVIHLSQPLNAKSFERVTLLHTALMLHVSTRVCSANDQLAPSDNR